MKFSALSLIVILSSAGCSSSDESSCEPEGAGPVEPLQWKRMRALEADLMQALSLGRDELCRELDLFNCTEIHRVSLGASDPLGSALYEPVARPLATTPTAFERVALAGCSRRAELDALGSPVVFSHFSLAGSAPAPGSAELEAQIQDLYRRLLQRDATGEEIAIAAELAAAEQGQTPSGLDIAKLTCFAIATTTEFLLF